MEQINNQENIEPTEDPNAEAQDPQGEVQEIPQEETELKEEGKDEVLHPEELPNEVVVTDEETGEQILKVGSSIYKGKDLNELLINVRNGIEAKDNYINQLKVDKKVAVEEPQVEKVEEIPTPDKNTIYNSVIENTFKQANVDIDMIGWSEQDWINYADENGLRDFQIIDKRNNVGRLYNQAVQKADAEYNTVNQKWWNTEQLNNAQQRVKNIILTSGIDPDKIDYKSIVNEAKQKARNGYIDALDIVEIATKQIFEATKTKTESKVKQQLEREIALKGGKKVPEPTSQKKYVSPIPKFNSIAETTEYFKNKGK